MTGSPAHGAPGARQGTEMAEEKGGSSVRTEKGFSGRPRWRRREEEAEAEMAGGGRAGQTGSARAPALFVCVSGGAGIGRIGSRELLGIGGIG